MFRTIDDIRPPKARIGDTVYIGAVGGDKPCTVTNVQIGKVRRGRKLYRTWYYNLDVSGVVARPEDMIGFSA